MTDIESLLRAATDLPAHPSPVTAVHAAVRRSRRRRALGAAVAVVAAAALAVPLAVVGGNDEPDVLVPAAAACPSSFSRPTDGPADRLFPADVTSFEVCTYEDHEVVLDGEDEDDNRGGRLLERFPVPGRDVPAVTEAFTGLPLAVAVPTCLRTRQVRVLVLGRTADGLSTPVTLNDACGLRFANGRVATEAGPTPALARLLGLSGPAAVEDSSCPPVFETPAANGQGPTDPLLPPGTTQIEVCTYEPQRGGSAKALPLEKASVLTGNDAAVAAQALNGLPPGGERACSRARQPRVLLNASTDEGPSAQIALTGACGVLFTDGLTTVLPDEKTLALLGIDLLDLLAPTRPENPAVSDLVRVEGRLLSDGSPQPTGTVELTDSTGRTTSVEAAGRYVVYLPAGTYSIRVTGPRPAGLRCESYTGVVLSGRGQTVGIDCGG